LATLVGVVEGVAQGLDAFAISESDRDAVAEGVQEIIFRVASKDQAVQPGIAGAVSTGPIL
jgi:hypothetical protein